MDNTVPVVPVPVPVPLPQAPADIQAQTLARLFRASIAAQRVHPLLDLLRRYRAGERG